MSYDKKLLCDLMLQKLGRILILCGYDVKIVKKPLPLKELIEIAQKENRIILTRNTKIRGHSIPYILLTEQKPYEQLKTLIKIHNFSIEPSAIFTRCSICNSELERVEKDAIISQIPPLTQRNTDEFFICSTCKKIYWKQTHYQLFMEKIKEITTLSSHL